MTGDRARGSARWPRARVISTARFRLEPIAEVHAAEMSAVLSDPALYRYIGGEPPTEQDLRAKYARQAAGSSPRGDQGWLNWIVRSRGSGRAAGYVQATVSEESDIRIANLAWVIAPEWQGMGYATEAAQVMLEWLHGKGITEFRASIHSENSASQAVAYKLGFRASGQLLDGETVWALRQEANPPA